MINKHGVAGKKSRIKMAFKKLNFKKILYVFCLSTPMLKGSSSKGLVYGSQFTFALLKWYQIEITYPTTMQKCFRIVKLSKLPSKFLFFYLFVVPFFLWYRLHLFTNLSRESSRAFLTKSFHSTWSLHFLSLWYCCPVVSSPVLALMVSMYVVLGLLTIWVAMLGFPKQHIWSSKILIIITILETNRTNRILQLHVGVS